MRYRIALALCVLGLVGACVAKTDEVKLLRTQLPSNGPGCPVSRLATDDAPYAVEDLVQITLRYAPGGQDVALRRIEDQACYYGGDTVYKIREAELTSVTTQIVATIARRTDKPTTGPSLPAMPSASAK